MPKREPQLHCFSDWGGLSYSFWRLSDSNNILWRMAAYRKLYAQSFGSQWPFFLRLACRQSAQSWWFCRPSCFRFLFSHNLFSDLDKSRLRDNKLRNNCCYAAVLFFSCHCLLPPNDGLTPPNDSLLPPNNGLLPPNEKEVSGTHAEMRAQWLSLRARCGVIAWEGAKAEDKNILLSDKSFLIDTPFFWRGQKVKGWFRFVKSALNG